MYNNYYIASYYFQKYIASIPSKDYKFKQKYAENAAISYQYPYYTAISISDNLDILGI
jgi:hypothetical protein